MKQQKTNNKSTFKGGIMEKKVADFNCAKGINKAF